MPDSSSERLGSGRYLHEAVTKIFGSCDVHLLQRRHFNETAGIEVLKQYAADEVSNLDQSVYKK